MRKAVSILCIVIFFMTVLFALCPRAEAAITFTEQPTSSGHLCRINCYDPLYPLNPRGPGPYYPYVGGYAASPDFSFGYWYINKVSVTASFSGTNPGALGSSNWLAAGLFLEGMDHITDGQDYAYYDVIVLDNLGNLYLDVGAWKEADDALHKTAVELYNSLELVFDRCWLIQGINYQNPMTLNMYWSPSATPQNAMLYWSVTINGATIYPPNNSFNMTAGADALVPGSEPFANFQMGSQKWDLFLRTWACYFFQFGIMSPKQIQQTGWQVHLSYPKYANTSSSPWQDVVTACLLDGYNSFLDATWMWGMETFQGVDVASETGNEIMWNVALEPIGIAEFYYDGHTANFAWPWVPLWSTWGFAQENLQIICLGSGTTHPPVGTYQYDQGDNAVVRATPSAGYTSGGYTHTFRFSCWFLNGSLYTIGGIICTNNTLTLSMNANYVLTACFTEEVTGGPPGGGGGGCPYVFTWSGKSFVKDNNILPASEDSDGTDVKDYYMLQRSLVPVLSIRQGSLYSLQIREDETEQDYIDQVKLMAIDHSAKTDIAVTPDGQIISYANPTSPISCIDDAGDSRLREVGRIDGDVSNPATYFQGYKGDWLILNFGRIAPGNANLILRDDQKCTNELCIDVQIPDGKGDWLTIEVLHPRDFWGMEAVKMGEYVPVTGDFVVRLLWTATHRLDFVGLANSRPVTMRVTSTTPTLAVHSTLGNVIAELTCDDNNKVVLVQGQQVTLAFLLPNADQNMIRDFVLYTDGYYT